MFRAAPEENSTQQLLSALQRKRKHAKLPPLVLDTYLQAQAEELAYEKMSETVSKLGDEARDRRFKNWGAYYWDQEEQILSNLAKVKVNPEATHIGLYVIPHALGGGVVFCTARKPAR